MKTMGKLPFSTLTITPDSPPPLKDWYRIFAPDSTLSRMTGWYAQGSEPLGIFFFTGSPAPNGASLMILQHFTTDLGKKTYIEELRIFSTAVATLFSAGVVFLFHLQFHPPCWHRVILLKNFVPTFSSMDFSPATQRKMLLLVSGGGKISGLWIEIAVRAAISSASFLCLVWWIPGFLRFPPSRSPPGSAHPIPFHPHVKRRRLCPYRPQHGSKVIQIRVQVKGEKQSQVGWRGWSAPAAASCRDRSAFPAHRQVKREKEEGQRTKMRPTSPVYEARGKHSPPIGKFLRKPTKTTSTLISLDTLCFWVVFQCVQT